MAKTILQINYTFAASRTNYVAMAAHSAKHIADVDGLVWKIWLMNEAHHAGGGIYLFESLAAADNFVESQAVADFFAHPGITNISVNTFEAEEALSLITRGPLMTQKIY